MTNKRLFPSILSEMADTLYFEQWGGEERISLYERKCWQLINLRGTKATSVGFSDGEIATDEGWGLSGNFNFIVVALFKTN